MTPDSEPTVARQQRPQTRPGIATGRLESWNFKDISWSFVFGAQHYGTLVLTLFPTVALAIVVFGAKEKPVNDELGVIMNIRMYGWRMRQVSIPTVFAVVVPLVYFLVILIVIEFQLFKHYHKHITNAAHAVLYFMIALFCGFVVHIFVHQISAIVVAEPRPDFLERCHSGSSLVSGGADVCSGDVSDAYSSFFSGHASSSMVIATFSTVYMVWSLYFRASMFRNDMHSRLFLTMRQTNSNYCAVNRITQEFVHGAVMYLIILQIGFTWIVGVSRIIDNRHHIWDVNTGFLVGTIVGVLFAFQAIGVYGLMPVYKKPAANLNSETSSCT